MTDVNDKVIWKESMILWGSLIMLFFIFVSIFYDGLVHMVTWWENREEYGHGYIIPFITLFLIWQKKDQLETIKFESSWWGVALLISGLMLFYVGELSSIYTIIQYAYLMAIYGVLLSLMGWRAFRVIIIPLFILIFMIPLPSFVLNNLSSQLQLISSQIGVFVIRLFDISVFLEGNVIDLGVYKLQVIEACSGLNYLFPLMTLAFISAYFFTGAFWKKAIIFLSSIPITVLMNSFRIGVIGVMVEYWGIEMAEGFLHDFEGWAVFMSCIAILVLEMWLLAKIGKDKLPLREAFGLDFPEPSPEDADFTIRKLPVTYIISVIAVVLVAISSFALPERQEVIPDRKLFAGFPMELADWAGEEGRIEQDVLSVLKLSDYAMINYKRPDSSLVNFYSAYYESQKKGASAHSPRSCIPGGGWRITSLENHSVSGVEIAGLPLVVNRLVIQKGDTKQLVYYWFQQRGRIITNEYLVKWYLFWDALTQSRTDGALIRITTILEGGQDLELADERLESFAREIAPILTDYVPE